MDDELTFTFTFILEFIFIMILIWVGLHFFIKDDLSEITKHYSEITATTGGFTTTQYENFLDDLREINIDPNECDITIKAIDDDGNDISSKAINVTPTNESPYPADPNFCPRGTQITLTVVSNKESALNKVFKFIGIDSDIKKGVAKKVYMSERVR